MVKTITLEMVKHICILQEKSKTVAVSPSNNFIHLKKKKQLTFFPKTEAGHERIGNTILL